MVHSVLGEPPTARKEPFPAANSEQPNYLSWLAKAATCAEKLHITLRNSQSLSKEYPLLPKKSLRGLLIRLSACSPKLRKLSITCPQNRELFNGHRVPQECAYQWQGYIWHHWAEALQLMRQVEHLHVSAEFVPLSDGQGPYSLCPPPQDFFRGMALQARYSFPALIPVCLWLA